MAETCPTCESKNRAERICLVTAYKHVSRASNPSCKPCTDSWHDAKEEKMRHQVECSCDPEYAHHCPKCNGAGYIEVETAPAQATREQLACRDCREPVIGSVHVVLVSGTRMCFKCFNAMGDRQAIGGVAGANWLLGGK